MTQGDGGPPVEVILDVSPLPLPLMHTIEIALLDFCIPI